MNNEHNDNDALVSAAYRDSAQEKAPPELDKAVLRMAANAKPAAPKAGLPLWMRPVAWAATIGLTLAIVFDVTEVSDTAGAPAPASAPPAASIEEAFSSENADVVQEAEDLARMRDGPSQPEPVAKTRQEQAKRADAPLDTDAVEESVASRAYGNAAAVSDDAVAMEMGEMKLEWADNEACSETSRETADSWYDCVLELRDTDRTNEADREMRQLLEKFPEFQPNK